MSAARLRVAYNGLPAPKIDLGGKRGSVELAFHLVDDGEIVGRGKKHLLVSGLRDSATIFTPRNGLPVWSVTKPSMEPFACAKAMDGAANM